jgi:hypothetical protein
MKFLILALLGSFLISTGMAQNGGQYPENGSVKLEWVGTSVKITNKQSCESVIKVSYAQTDVDLTIPSNSSIIFMPPAAVATVKAKCTTNCGSTDFGWIELTLTAMPLKLASFDVQAIGNKEVIITFETTETSHIKQYNILISKDGINYIPIDSIKADQINPNRKYSLKINTSKVKL